MVEIGVVPNPREWDRWGEAEAFLEPARARGDFPSVLEPGEILWAVLDDGDLTGCATAWLSSDGFVEVKLLGGRNCRRWLKALDERIGAAAAEAGATRLVGIGRVEWTRILRRNGWAKCQPVEDHWLFEREL